VISSAASNGNSTSRNETAAQENETREDHSMARVRSGAKTVTMPAVLQQAVPEPVTQRHQSDGGRYRLQVDRQAKASYATYEASEKAGKGIKKNYPILQVAVYDGVESVNKVIKLL
jgi:hypothetical protein